MLRKILNTFEAIGHARAISELKRAGYYLEADNLEKLYVKTHT